MRAHPISLALRSLRGERSLHGRALPDKAAAGAILRQFTGQDFGQDATRWGAVAANEPLGLYCQFR